jgi:hypothetical protein
MQEAAQFFKTQKTRKFQIKRVFFFISNSIKRLAFKQKLRKKFNNNERKREREKERKREKKKRKCEEAIKFFFIYEIGFK